MAWPGREIFHFLVKMGTPPKNAAALDVWQGRLVAHESGCKPMLAERGIGELVVACQGRKGNWDLEVWRNPERKRELEEGGGAFAVTQKTLSGFLGMIYFLLIGLGIKDYWFVLLKLFVCMYALFNFSLASWASPANIWRVTSFMNLIWMKEIMLLSHVYDTCPQLYWLPMK